MSSDVSRHVNIVWFEYVLRMSRMEGREFACQLASIPVSPYGRPLGDGPDALYPSGSVGGFDSPLRSLMWPAAHAPRLKVSAR